MSPSINTRTRSVVVLLKRLAVAQYYCGRSSCNILQKPAALHIRYVKAADGDFMRSL